MAPTTIPFLLHLTPLSPSEIPAHPSIPCPLPAPVDGETTDPRPPLPTFLHAALTQAREFITTTIPGFTVDPKLRDSPPSTAQVQVSTGTVKYTPLNTKSSVSADTKKEKWFARRTVLDNHAVSGTASFEEFVAGLKDNHLLNEIEYEPRITAVEDIAKWDCSGVEAEGGWSGVEAALSLVMRTFQPENLISPRAFLALIITAFTPPESPTSTQPSGFINIQLPVHSSAAQSLSLPKNALLAHSLSVEQVRILPDAPPGAGPGKLEWIMATNPDAGGWIPQILQRSGTVKAIVQDVGLFLNWVGEQRAKKLI